jgi:hypothetical protein
MPLQLGCQHGSGVRIDGRTVIAMPHRPVRIATATALQLLALVLAHELVFLARYGSRFGEALVHSGHGEAWSAAVITSAGLAIGLAAAGFLRLARLGLLVRRRGRVRVDRAAARSLSPRGLLRGWFVLALRMAILGAVLLTLQENVERWAIGQAAPGPGILLSVEYPNALLITIAVAFAVSLVAALFEWRRRILEERLRAARAPLPRAIESTSARPGALVRPRFESILGRRSALRAPPLVVAA